VRNSGAALRADAGGGDVGIEISREQAVRGQKQSQIPGEGGKQ